MQDLLCLMVNDEFVTYDGTAIWGIRHDFHGFMHAVNKPDLLDTLTM